MLSNKKNSTRKFDTYQEGQKETKQAGLHGQKRRNPNNGNRWRKTKCNFSIESSTGEAKHLFHQRGTFFFRHLFVIESISLIINLVISFIINLVINLIIN